MRLLVLAAVASTCFGPCADATADVALRGDTCTTGLPDIEGVVKPDPTFTLNGVYDYQGKTPLGGPYYRRRTGSAVYPVVYLVYIYQWTVAEGGCLQAEWPSWTPDLPLENADGPNCDILCGCDQDRTCYKAFSDTGLSEPPRSSTWFRHCNVDDYTLRMAIEIFPLNTADDDTDDVYDDDWDDDDDDDAADTDTTTTTAIATVPTIATTTITSASTTRQSTTTATTATTATTSTTTVTTTTTIASADTITTSTTNQSTSTASVTTTSATATLSTITLVTSAATTTSSEDSSTLSSTAITTTASARSTTAEAATTSKLQFTSSTPLDSGIDTDDDTDADADIGELLSTSTNTTMDKKSTIAAAVAVPLVLLLTAAGVACVARWRSQRTKLRLLQNTDPGARANFPNPTFHLNVNNQRSNQTSTSRAGGSQIVPEYLEANPGQPAVYDAAKRRRTLIVRNHPSSSNGNGNGALYAIPFDPADSSAVVPTRQTLLVQDRSSSSSNGKGNAPVYAIPFDPADGNGAVDANFQNSEGIYVPDGFYDQPRGRDRTRTRRTGRMLNMTYGSPIADGEGGEYAAADGGMQADAEA